MVVKGLSNVSGVDLIRKFISSRKSDILLVIKLAGVEVVGIIILGVGLSDVKDL